MPGKRATFLPDELTTWLRGFNQAAERALAAGALPTPATARAALATLTRQLGGDGPPIARVGDFTLAQVPEVPLRFYHPKPESPLPTVVYLHGGGHVAGSIAVYDAILRRLAHRAQCLVIAVDYRLAPEFPYPHALQDCLAVLETLPQWLEYQGWDDGRGLILAGDSGGGALAATLSAHRGKKMAAQLRGQILIYPSLDYTLQQPSVTSNGQGYFLDTARIRWYFNQYFKPGDDRQAASPLFMAVEHLPPTLIFTAGFCPLRDEGYAYAERLTANTIACRHINLPDTIHAYLNLHTLIPEPCDTTYRSMAEWMHQLGPTPT